MALGVTLKFGHKVTVGNGIEDNEKDLSSKPTVTGFSFHSIQTFRIDLPHNQNAKPTITIQKNLNKSQMEKAYKIFHANCKPIFTVQSNGDLVP